MTETIDKIRLEAVEKRRNQVSDALQSRKRKLSELYLVANLAKVRTVVDENALGPVKQALSSFLEQNDVEKGNEFNIDTLLVEDVPHLTPSSDGYSIAAPNIDSNKDVLPKDTKDQEKDTTSRQQVQPPLPPLPRKPIVKRKKTPESHVSLFDPDNKEAIETNILVLKEYLPAKVSEATSLAELYYLAQTLPLVRLVPSTHKAVTSAMYETALTEGKINVVHSRIEELKRQGKWSLRQPTKFDDPIRGNTNTFWDNLLSEMNWMAIDFKEERKLKIATCAFIAESIKDYWKYGKVCCVKRKFSYQASQQLEAQNIQLDDILTVEAFQDEPMTDEETITKELVDEPKEAEITTNADVPRASEEDGEPESEDVELSQNSNEIPEGIKEDIDAIDIEKLLQRPRPEDEIKPPTLPEISYEEYLRIKGQEISPFKVLIDTNNMDQSNKTLLDNIPTFSSFQSFDTYSSAPLIPVSKSLIPVEDDLWYNVHLKQVEDTGDVIVDQQKGLFGFSSQKKISTSTKPPPPPSLKYLDLRTPTIWLPEDDQDLIEFVNQFSFNWGVVSAHLAKRPSRNYSSNIERRTPWQCFERYIQLNDTFQINDMRGQNTISAMKWLEHAHNIQATTKRRISPLGVGVDSIQRGHKRLRWASMFEAIRKCMRKRENVTKPNTSQIRRTDENAAPLATLTPSELSKLKYERDKTIQDAHLQNLQNGFRTRPPNAQSLADKPGVPQSQPHPPLQQSSDQQPRPIPPQIQANKSQPPSSQPQVPIPAATPAQQFPPNAVPTKRPVSTIPVAINAQRSNSNQYPNQVIGTTPKVNPATGTPYTPEQIQQILQLKQRKLIQSQAAANAAANGMIQGSPSPNNGKAQLVPSGTSPLRGNITPRANSNPASVQQQNGAAVTPVPLNQQGVPANNGSDGRKMFVPAHVSAIINQIQSQNPNMTKQDVTKYAAQYLANLQAKQNRANNTNAGAVNSASPQLQHHQPQASSSPVASRPAGTPGSVPTPQQILLQQQQKGVQRTSSDPNLGKIAGGRAPQASPAQNISPSPALTPQQKAQLDMLKSLHAEQQQKRQQELNSQQKTASGAPQPKTKK